MAELSVNRLMEAVQDQRSKLINVLGVVQCMQIAVRSSHPPKELEGAVELLEEEVQRILDGLDPMTLEKVEAEEAQS
jgi:hypothetical protein